MAETQSPMLTTLKKGNGMANAIKTHRGGLRKWLK